MELKLLTVIFDLRFHPNDLNQQVYTKGYIPHKNSVQKKKKLV